MRLSVVIPTFNSAALTLHCCACVVAALPGGSEIIVVDDASSDETVERLAREQPSIRLVRNESNRGFASSANRGAEVAAGDFILFLNSDTCVQPDALSRMLNAFDADPKLGIAGAQLVGPDGASQWSGGGEPGFLWLVAAATGAGAALRRARGARAMQDREVDWVPGAAMVICRNAWERIGPLREDFEFYAQDLDLCVRARDAGWRVKIVADARVEHTGGATFGNDARAANIRNDDLLLWYAGRRGALRARAARELIRVLGCRPERRKGAGCGSGAMEEIEN